MVADRSPGMRTMTAEAQRDVAQSGSALVWGTRGRGFKSRRPDHDESCARPTPSGCTSDRGRISAGSSSRGGPVCESSA
jgi:hypothetical protein